MIWGARRGQEKMNIEVEKNKSLEYNSRLRGGGCQKVCIPNLDTPASGGFTVEKKWRQRPQETEKKENKNCLKVNTPNILCTIASSLL